MSQFALSATTKVLCVPAGDLGALLVGVGAILLLADAVTAGSPFNGFSFGGTLTTPRARLSSAVEFVGSLLVALGSALLLANSRGLTLLTVVVVVALSALLIYLVMTARLYGHMRLLAKQQSVRPRRSLLWCFFHPFWKPPEQQ